MTDQLHPWEKLRAEVERMDMFKDFPRRLDMVLDSARVNADDTVFVERACDVTGWHDIALGSIETVLAYSTDKKVLAWFAKRGVKP